ncbi:type I restriction endonuclease subunit R [Anaerotignum sp.]|uniref:type I restriction endonuclease subunit R n=1 Tax=Anaerotignum sp. TaxID=2039241 RepID=UPI0028AD281C|nr:type I restriction endonuclease subunit R [Anaerotignum sp.]
MPNFISEDMIEQACIQKLVMQNGYNSINCMTEKPETLPDGSGRENKKQVVLPCILLERLVKINPHLPISCVEKVAAELIKTPNSADLMQTNYQNYQKIRNGINVEYEENGKKKPSRLKVIDFEQPENNTFTVVSQLWIKGEVHWRRPDLIIYINGLPLVFIELKNSNIPVKNAFDVNLKNYLKDIPYLFNYNQVCVLSSGTETRLGSFSAGYEHFFEWLKTESEKESPDKDVIKENAISLEYLVDGLLKKETLVDYIENFILYDRQKVKLIAKNHQYLGVNNAFNAFLNREQLGGKLGVFWHTQGSGKSYSMVMLTRKIKHKISGNFTFLVITDREDLDTQIWKNFWRTEFISKDEKLRPANSTRLREELQTNKTILFTLIHKFRYDKGKEYPVLSTRDDIIVIVDEAHRTQYKDLAENMRKGLPNAQFMAFTGTPLLGSKRLTNSWFGDYVSEYNFAQSIKDNATVPLYYVNGMKEVQLENDFLDSDFAEIIENEELTDAEKQRLENHYARELEIIKRDDRLEKIAQHIAFHFPRRGFLGKGMVISVDKFTAVKMYDKVQHYWKEEIKSLNSQIAKTADPDERNNLKSMVDYMRSVHMAVVISEEDKEEEKFNLEGLSVKYHRERMNSVDDNGFDIEDNFKNPDHPLQLVFVCSMWLTGFDAPSVSTLYLDKPMKGHTLMQTIARANRVYPGKENGIVIGYLDVFKSLKKALVDYASDDTEDIPVKEIDKLYHQLLEVIELTKSFCISQGVDLAKVVNVDDVFGNLSDFEAFADILVSNDEVKNEFRVYANTVKNTYDALRPDIFKMNFDPTYKEVIVYLKDIIDGKIRPEKLESAKEKINALLDQSIIAAPNAVSNSNAGTAIAITTTTPIDLSKLNIEELSEQFKKVKYKNLEIANLREYIEKKLAQMMKQNVTRGAFAERFRNIIDDYNSGGAQNDEFYKKLLKFMEELKAEEARHIKEELSEAELELYDLLQKDKLTKDELKRVKLAAKELYNTLLSKKNELFVIGWEKDDQPKEKVRSEIMAVLNEYLPDSYDREVFSNKINLVFTHIIDQAMMGFNWVA